MTRRTLRIAEQLRAELARLLREKALDPRLAMVVLTRVDVSPDLQNARVYWSRLQCEALPDDDAVPQADPETARGLAAARGFLRSELARCMPQRRVPALHFHYDPSIAVGSRIAARLGSAPDGAPQ